MNDSSLKSASETKFLLTGASGWFGKIALREYEQLFGPDNLRNQILAYASCSKPIHYGSPHGPIYAAPLEEINRIVNAQGLLHLAFLTREHIATKGFEEYVSKNRHITSCVASLIQRLPQIPIITTSSGAAAFFDQRSRDLRSNPYATLKQEEEDLWRSHASSRMAVVFRVYAASGHLHKEPSLFALGDFIRQAQLGQQITIRSKRPVIRSYVPIGTLMRIAWLMLKNPLPVGYRQVDAVTHTLSLFELANNISQHWGLPSPKTELDPSLPADIYKGDPTAFEELLNMYNLPSPTILEQILETASSLD